MANRPSKRRFLNALLVGGLFALLLAFAVGCGSSGDDTGTTSTEGTSAEQGDREPVTLSLGWWFDPPPNGEPGATLIGDFEEKYPWITVKPETSTYAQYYNRVGAWVEAGDGPDVIAIEAGNLWFPYKESLQSVDKIDPSINQELDKVANPEVLCWEFDCKPGNVYSIGFDRIGYLLYYNKTILEEAGLDPESPPTTFPEMAAACEKIKEAGKACWAMGAMDLGLVIALSEMALRTATTEQMKALGEGKASWTDPEFLQALQIMEYMGAQDWYQDGYLAADLSTGTQEAFVSGQTAFALGLTGQGLSWAAYGEQLGFENVGAVAMPEVVEGQAPDVTPGPLNETTGVTPSTGLAVPTWSKHPEEAALLVKFTLEESVQEALPALGERAFMPSIKNSQVEWAPEEAQPLYGETLEIANNTESPDLLPFIGYDYLAVLNTQLQELSEGETTAEAAAKAIDKAAAAAR